MPTYSYQPCTDIRVGAIIYEKTEDGDVAVLTTAHIAGYARELERKETKSVGKEKQAC